MKSDLGKKYGLKLPELYIHPNDYQINFLVKDIKKNYTKEDPILIYDWGGGNGLFSKTIINKLKEYNNLKIVIIDSDGSKFIKRSQIENINSNIIDFCGVERCDYSVVRNIFHYNAYSDNLKILNKIYDYTKRNLLFINIFAQENEIEGYKIMEKYLKRWFGVLRSYPNKKTLKQAISDSNWKIGKFKIDSNEKFDCLDFCKRRFNLNSERLEKLKEENLNALIKTSNTLMFWCVK